MASVFVTASSPFLSTCPDFSLWWTESYKIRLTLFSPNCFWLWCFVIVGNSNEDSYYKAFHYELPHAH